jgi:glycine/D-amino acid oxidase-like deaminating enzyme
MITHHKKLRTHDPLWLHERAPAVPYGTLQRDISTEVLVVGGGITGAMVAQALAAEGFDVVLLDRRVPAHGATAASTALVQHEIDTPLIELRDRIGAADATRAWRRSRLAVDQLRTTFRLLGIAAQSRDSLYLAGNRLDPRKLKQEAAARRAIGLEIVYLTAGTLDARFGIARKAALLGFDNLAINPRRATVEFLRRAAHDGARLYAPVDVQDLETNKTRTVVRTGGGPTIRAGSVVLATGYEFPRLVPMRGHRIITTWAFATRAQPRKLWPEQCLIWEASDPYLYLRTTEDGRVVCGGEDSPHAGPPADNPQMDARLARLQRKLGKLFPQLDTRAQFAWAASFGETTTGLPTIAPIPRHRNCWVALGYGGNGITYARIAADIIRAALIGRPDPDARLYAFR